MAEQLVDLVKMVLASDITNVATSLTVVSVPTGTPTTGTFTIRLHNTTTGDVELVRSSGRTGTTFTLTARGAGNPATTGIAFAAADVVQVWIVQNSNSLDTAIDERITDALTATPRYDTVQDEGSSVTQRSTLNFVGAGVIVDDSASKTRVTIPGAHVIEDEGTPVTQRENMNFAGLGVSVADSGGKTVVTIPGGIGAAYTNVEDEGSGVTQRSTLNFAGAGVTVTDSGGKTLVTIAGGSGGNVTTSGTFASLPGSPNAGDVHFSTDGGYISRYNGSAWEHYFHGVKCTPISGSYSWVNPGSATVDSSKGHTRFSYPAGTGEDEHLYVRACSTTDSLEAFIIYDPSWLNFQHSGICVYETSTGKMYQFTIYNDNNLAVFTRATPTSAPTSQGTWLQSSRAFIWLKIAVTPTTITFYVKSNPDAAYVQVLQVSTGTFLTPSHIGFTGHAQNSTYPYGMNVYHIG